MSMVQNVWHSNGQPSHLTLPFEYRTSNVSDESGIGASSILKVIDILLKSLIKWNLFRSRLYKFLMNILDKFLKTNPDLYDNRGVTLIGWGSNKKGGDAQPKLSRATLVIYKYK